MALYASITGDLTDRALARLWASALLWQLPGMVGDRPQGGRIRERERARRLAKTLTWAPEEESVPPDRASR
jgi:hypothetical protein